MSKKNPRRKYSKIEHGWSPGRWFSAIISLKNGQRADQDHETKKSLSGILKSHAEQAHQILYTDDKKLSESEEDFRYVEKGKEKGRGSVIKRAKISETGENFYIQVMTLDLGLLKTQLNEDYKILSSYVNEENGKFKF